MNLRLQEEKLEEIKDIIEMKVTHRSGLTLIIINNYEKVKTVE